MSLFTRMPPAHPATPFVRSDKKHLQSEKQLRKVRGLRSRSENQSNKPDMKSAFHIAAEPCTSRIERDAGYRVLRLRRHGLSLFD